MPRIETVKVCAGDDYMVINKCDMTKDHKEYKEPKKAEKKEPKKAEKKEPKKAEKKEPKKAEKS